MWAKVQSYLKHHLEAVAVTKSVAGIKLPTLGVDYIYWHQVMQQVLNLSFKEYLCELQQLSNLGGPGA